MAFDRKIRGICPGRLETSALYSAIVESSKLYEGSNIGHGSGNIAVVSTDQSVGISWKLTCMLGHPLYR
jgi:hypothetical protein